MGFGGSLLCILSLGVYPFAWDIIKEKIKFNTWNLKQQICFGVMLTLFSVQIILVTVLIVSPSLFLLSSLKI